MDSQPSSSRISGARSIFDQIDKYITLVTKWMYWIAGAGLIAMLALVVGDILGIKVLAHPIPGGIEITAFLGVVVIGFAIAFVQTRHGHIQVDFFLNKIPPRPKVIIDSITTFLGVLFFIVLAWRSVDYGNVMVKTGEVSMTQKIPFYPFIYALAFCFLMMGLVLMVELVKLIMKARNKWTQ